MGLISLCPICFSPNTDTTLSHDSGGKVHCCKSYGKYITIHICKHIYIYTRIHIHTANSMRYFAVAGSSLFQIAQILLILSIPSHLYILDPMGWGKGKRERAQPKLQQARGKGKSSKPHRQLGSHLAEFLLEQWSWGLISPQLVQGISHRARMDFENWQAAWEPQDPR